MIPSKNVYFISGLAADERLFENLKLPPEYTIRHLAWIEPLKKESMNAYSRRLAAQIDTTAPFVLVGMSFGGLVAVEMNKFLQPKQTILISSIVTQNGLSFFFRLVNRLKLHKIVPSWLLKNFRPGAYWFFNARTRQQKVLVASFMDNASKALLKWSVDKLLNWRNQYQPPNIFLINGDDDRVFPHKRTPADVVVEDGGHMMVHNKADEISPVLAKELAKVKWEE
ncbi:MAG TPA: alpha/beta hydrolase [Adhaeribacter sp.]|nr:alpha/beta hydrolase [Adhaeribacter sp.]